LTAASLHKLCSHCHQFPEPGTLPRRAWAAKIREMVQIRGYGTGLTPPPVERIIAWYESHAPEQLSLAESVGLPDQVPSLWQRVSPHASPQDPDCFTANVCFPDGISGPVAGAATLLSADMRHGRIELWNVGGHLVTASHTIGKIPHPAHMEPVDFDRDGLCDLLVANLGSFSAIDHNLGSVEWLRQNSDGSFETIRLCDGLGRVSDVRAADFDSDGDLDLVVAEFGWRLTGKTLILENNGSLPQPTFTRHHLDARCGAIHVPVVDLNSDGRPDIVVLLGQQYEMVVAFFNEGNFRFSTRELFHASHPAWGATGLEPVDLDRDGDLDFLVTNGDTFDDDILKPDHGVTWLENRGQMSFFPHWLVPLPGAHRAQAIDVDGDGDLDILACAMTGSSSAKPDVTRNLPSLVLLEHVSPGKFSSSVLERSQCFHPTLAVSQKNRTGFVNVAVGNAFLHATPGAPPAPAVTIWQNQRQSPP